MSDAPMLGFPQPLTEKYAPRTLEEFVGLRDIKPALAGFLANPYPSAWLFVGPSGTGKTNMARALFDAIPVELHHVPSRDCTQDTVNKTCFECQRFPWDPWHPDRQVRMHGILVDEANEMTPPAQDAWLSKLDGTANPPSTVIIFTSNDTYRLQDRFLSRCRVVRFGEQQPLEDVAGMLQRIWTTERGDAPGPDYVAIAKECGGNIRSSLMKLELALLGMLPAASQATPTIESVEVCRTCGAAVLPRREYCDPCYDKRTRVLAHHSRTTRRKEAVRV